MITRPGHTFAHATATYLSLHVQHYGWSGYYFSFKNNIHSYKMWIISSQTICEHDDVIKWKHFPRSWPFVRGIHRSPVDSPHKGQWRGALMFSLICAWINGQVNNREAGLFETPSRPRWRHCNGWVPGRHVDRYAPGQQFIPGAFRRNPLQSVCNRRNCLECCWSENVTENVALMRRWGLLKLRSLISQLWEILIQQNYMLDSFNQVHICQVYPQLSCGDTIQIWTWHHTGNQCFHYSEKLGK